MGATAVDRFRRRRVAALPAAVVLVALLLTALAFATEAHAEGRIVVREGARRLVAIPPQGGRPRTLVHLHRGAMLGTAVSRDGKVIAFASRTFRNFEDGESGRIEHEWTDRIWVMPRGGHPRVVRTLESTGAERGYKSVDSIALSPDGRELLVQKRRGNAFLMRTEGSGLHQVVPAGYDFISGGGQNHQGAEFTPDGKRIIGVFYPSTKRVTDIGGIGTVALSGGAVHLLATGPFTAQYGDFAAPTISPDSRRIAFVSSGPEGTRIALMNRDGSGRHRLRATLRKGWNFGNPSFSPSGRSLTLVGTHPGVATTPGTGNTIIGRTPSVLFTIGLDGHRLRPVETEKARRYERDPIWVARLTTH